jgi:flagellar motor switch protein FliG
VLARLLHPLNRRQQTLLLTILSFGGSSAVELLSLLPEAEAEALLEKARKLEEIPKDKRIPLMVRQLRQMMSFRTSKGLEGVEPSWLIAGFRGESPRTVAIVLMHMPSSISRQITSRLPEAVRTAMPTRQELTGIPLEVVKLVRARFDAKFASMPSERDLETLHFGDVVLLSARELVTLIRKLGADELAAAFVAVGKRALAELLGRLPPEHAEELIAAVKRVSIDDSMELKAAQAFLGKVLGNFHNTDELFQKAGLYRLSRAVSGDEANFVRQLSQRFPRAHGRLVHDYLARIRARDPITSEQLRRLRDHVLDEIVDLSRRGKIDARYGQSPLTYEARAS